MSSENVQLYVSPSMCLNTNSAPLWHSCGHYVAIRLVTNKRVTKNPQRTLSTQSPRCCTAGVAKPIKIFTTPIAVEFRKCIKLLNTLPEYCVHDNEYTRFFFSFNQYLACDYLYLLGLRPIHVGKTGHGALQRLRRELKWQRQYIFSMHVAMCKIKTKWHWFLFHATFSSQYIHMDNCPINNHNLESVTPVRHTRSALTFQLVYCQNCDI